MDVEQVGNFVGDLSTSKLSTNQRLVNTSAAAAAIPTTTTTTTEEEEERHRSSPNSTSNHFGDKRGNLKQNDNNETHFKHDGGRLVKKQPRYKRYMKHDKKQRMFSCEHCDERFTVRANMKRHMSVHTGRKDYKCHLCDYKCARNDALTSHLRVHFGSPRYTCGGYGNKFRTSSQLTIHQQACKRKMIFNSMISQSTANEGRMMPNSRHMLPFSLTLNHNNQLIQSASIPEKMTSFGSSLFAQHPTIVDEANCSTSTGDHPVRGNDIHSSTLTVMGENKIARAEQSPLDLRVRKRDQGPMIDVATSHRHFPQDFPQRSHQINDIQTLAVHSDKVRQEREDGNYFNNYKPYRGQSSDADAYNQRNTGSNFASILPHKYGRSPAQRQYFGVTPSNMAGNSLHSTQRSLIQAASSRGIIDTPQQPRHHYNEEITSFLPAINYAYKQANMHRLMYLQSSRRLYQLASLACSSFSTQQPTLIRGNSIEDQDESENE